MANIEEFLGDIEYGLFASNKILVNAVVKELEIIGEAANNVSHEYQTLHPEIPWNKMIDMRNFLIHEYFRIKADVVWGTCKHDLPQLRSAFSKMTEL